ncbi:PREDICTED: membrane protein FAM174 [Dinoponera quadriceps]|uniref:Membrane protein FAM174 n=1 Tax=Dinoponera quadriceps TaxID=609295 RepID=A0A6P3XNE9_DINQU|nr:PREDICTED: membrane protein FAM174 [Dinoponera quadriceps]
MTRSKIQKMKFFLLILLLAQSAVSEEVVSLRERRDATATVESKGKDKVDGQPAPSPGKNGQQAPVKTRPPVDTSNKTHITLKPPDVANKTAHAADDEHPNEGHTTFNTGALVRGFLVFVGLSILVMAYIVFRSFRLSKTRAQMVRKYGVLTHRQDVEMRPLPLEEEDDEDTTVFDASNVLTNNVQHQNT